MDRRLLLCLLPVAPAVLLSACCSEQESALDACRERDAEMRRNMTHVQEALDDLEKALDAFQTTDWRVALSRVKSSTGDLRKAVTNMSDEMGS